MDYDEVNNCMTEQQKNSLKTAALQQLLQKVIGGAQEYTSYDDVNNQLTEQQKNSYQTAALQQLAEADIGGGGAIVPLSDYINDMWVITDKDGLISAIEDGKGFYLGDSQARVVSILGGAVADGKITLTTSPIVDGSNGQLAQIAITYDEVTGAPISQETYAFTWPHVTSVGAGFSLLNLGKLTLNIGNDTYEYDGSQDVNITIADGENMEF